MSFISKNMDFLDNININGIIYNKDIEIPTVEMLRDRKRVLKKSNKEFKTMYVNNIDGNNSWVTYIKED